jgi:hypothetical protein
MSFVETSRKLEKEDYDYRPEIPGVISAPMAPRYWIWRAEIYNARFAHRVLSGFLAELEEVLMGRQDALTDIRPVLKKVEILAPGVAPRDRLPMVSLYLLFHQHIVNAGRCPNADTFMEQHVSILDEPSIESLVCHAILCQPTNWDPEVQDNVRGQYLHQRFYRNGLLLGPVFEAALTLHTAEAFRTAGNHERAARLIVSSVDNLPGNPVLLTLEQRFAEDDGLELNWRTLLLPKEARVQA